MPFARGAERQLSVHRHGVTVHGRARNGPILRRFGPENKPVPGSTHGGAGLPAAQGLVGGGFLRCSTTIRRISHDSRRSQSGRCLDRVAFHAPMPVYAGYHVVAGGLCCAGEHPGYSIAGLGPRSISRQPQSLGQRCTGGGRRIRSIAVASGSRPPARQAAMLRRRFGMAEPLPSGLLLRRRQGPGDVLARRQFGATSNLPIPWFETARLTSGVFTFHTVRVLVIELISYFPLFALAFYAHLRRVEKDGRAAVEAD